jgi:peptidoglycan hydrolase-like protein with peptidoglycan-binding domain
MKISLSKPFASDSRADAGDVRQMKRTLNRLGYYMPQKDGMTDIPDRAVFAGLKKFQQANGLKASGEARPGDTTMEKLNAAQEKLEGTYIWRTCKDEKVREDHTVREGQAFDWSSSPEGDHPGEDYGCRCWAEPADDSIRSVYPELFIIPTLRGLQPIRALIRAFFSKVIGDSATKHGNLRAKERGITSKEIQDAIKVAEKSGNVVSKTGKYGTPQKIYTGNGISVVIETDGRNAGKIITIWRN